MAFQHNIAPNNTNINTTSKIHTSTHNQIPSTELTKASSKNHQKGTYQATKSQNFYNTIKPQSLNAKQNTSSTSNPTSFQQNLPLPKNPAINNTSKIHHKPQHKNTSNTRINGYHPNQESSYLPTISTQNHQTETTKQIPMDNNAN